MKFSIERNNILPLLQTVCGVVDRKQSLPILSNLLIIAKDKEITFTSSDTEVEIVVKLSHIPESTGQVTVPAKKLLNICRALNDNSAINFNLSKGKVLVMSGRSKFSLATLPAADFPVTETLDDSDKIDIGHSDFKSLLEDTLFSMAQQDVRYYLNGLLLELSEGIIRAVATDGHRLALKEIKASVSSSNLRYMIIPRKGVIELNRLLDEGDGEVSMEVSENFIRVSKADVQLTSKLIDGKFPDYNKVIPEGSAHVINADKEVLKQVLNRASILSNEKYKGVKLSLKSGLLKAFANNPEQEEAEEEMEIDYVGDDFEIGFNATYLQQALDRIKTQQVILDIPDPNSSCLILPEGDVSCKYVVMPMRL